VTEPTAPRLAPLPPDRWDDDVRDALRAGFPEQVAMRFLATGPESMPMPMPTAVATMMHHPELAGRFLAYNGVLLQRPALAPRLRELIVLRVASRTHARYEWVQHVRLALRHGVTSEEIASIAAEPSAAAWTPLEAAALAATDQLVADHRVDDDTWKLLASDLDERQLVEFVFVVGTYTALAMAFNSFGLQLDPDLEELANTVPYSFEE
jgi:4-carboxymuconolactone decarboxylase